MAQSNREVAPRQDYHVSSVASHFSDFTRMDPPKYFELKVDEDSQYFLHKVYMIWFSMGVSTTEKMNLLPINLRTWLRHGTICGRIVGF